MSKQLVPINKKALIERVVDKFRCSWNSCQRTAVNGQRLPPSAYILLKEKEEKEILMRTDYENRRAAQEITPVSSNVSAVSSEEEASTYSGGMQPGGSRAHKGRPSARYCLVAISGDECRALQVSPYDHVCHCSKKEARPRS